jgi:hypothetical protein
MLKIFIEQNQFDIVFFRNSYRAFIIISLFFLVLNFCLLGYLFWKQLHIKLPPNFVTTSDGRVITIYPLSQNPPPPPAPLTNNAV